VSGRDVIKSGSESLVRHLLVVTVSNLWKQNEDGNFNHEKGTTKRWQRSGQ
jgi:hypothetical protein